MSSVPVHVAVAAGNQKIAVSGNDNGKTENNSHSLCKNQLCASLSGIIILNTQFKPITTIQNFTWVPDDQSNSEKFPIGLIVNPRNTSLVLNGRKGHLQFYSTHTRSLLYNVRHKTR